MTVLLFALAILIGFITGYIVGIDTTLTDAMIDKKEVLEIIESFKVFSNQKLSKEDFNHNFTLQLIQEEISGAIYEQENFEDE